MVLVDLSARERECFLITQVEMWSRLVHGAAGLVARRSAQSMPRRAVFGGQQLIQNQRSRPLATERFDSEEPCDYNDFLTVKDVILKRRLESPNRFQSITKREDRSDIPPEAVRAHFKGKYISVHRGCTMMKGPGDLSIYSQLFWYLRPKTIFDIGTYTGGTAIWMADMLKLSDVECDVYSMDINLSLIEDRVKELKPPNVTFIEGDSYKIEETFPDEFLLSKPHPWVVIEDAHENFHGVLTHFHDHMQKGDYFVIDDTNPFTPSSINLDDDRHDTWGPGKLNALKEFLKEYDEYYAVDSFFTDFLGYNGTGNWHGFIRRMK